MSSDLIGRILLQVLEAVDGRAGLNLSEFDHFLMSISKFEQNKLHHVEVMSTLLKCISYVFILS